MRNPLETTGFASAWPRLTAQSPGTSRRHCEATGHVVPLVRELIAQLVLERPGLGIQACVYLGEICVLDECGGVLGSTDPRPLGRSTRMPLADLSRLPWLLALSCAERKGKIKYSDRVMSALATEATCSGSLADALSHQVIKQDGDDREKLSTARPAEGHRRPSVV
eukprot:g30817.t1